MFQDQEKVYRDCITQFIECYKNENNLWDPTHKMYFNRKKKTTSYTKLIDILKEVEPKADRQCVARKINNLRTAYRKEIKKIKQARKTDDEYTPTLWYYYMLTFLKDFVFVENHLPPIEPLDPESLKKDEEPAKYTDTNVPECSSQPSVTIDRYDLLGKSIALKIRELPAKQRCLAEKYVNEVLFEAELGNLSYSHRLIGPPNSE